MKLALILLAICIIPRFLAAEEFEGNDESPPSLWRFEFDNDFFLGSDDQFSAGWSIQKHSYPADNWEDVDDTIFTRIITEVVPGLSLGDGRMARRGLSFGQLIQTPQDLSSEEFIPDDVPYAGVLSFANSWYAISDHRANGFQVLVGVLGPSSFAEEIQTFSHEYFFMGDEPQGWDHQLKMNRS